MAFDVEAALDWCHSIGARETFLTEQQTASQTEPRPTAVTRTFVSSLGMPFNVVDVLSSWEIIVRIASFLSESSFHVPFLTAVNLDLEQCHALVLRDLRADARSLQQYQEVLVERHAEMLERRQEWNLMRVQMMLAHPALFWQEIDSDSEPRSPPSSSSASRTGSPSGPGPTSSM